MNFWLRPELRELQQSKHDEMMARMDFVKACMRLKKK